MSPTQADPNVRVARGGTPCAKCWSDAADRLHELGTGMQSEHYTDLIQERDAADTPCTPDEQRGYETRPCDYD